MDQNEYLENAKKEIREYWFKNHVAKVTGEQGNQVIIWSKPGTFNYGTKFILSGNNVFISGDIGEAVYNLTCEATLDNLKDFDLSYFTGKLTAYSDQRWNFDSELAKSEIEEYFFEWMDVDHIDQLSEEENELYEELIDTTNNWSRHDHFQMAVYSIYDRTTVHWFDGETASSIASCGERLPRRLIAYWVGLKMVAEQFLSLDEAE